MRFLSLLGALWLASTPALAGPPADSHMDLLVRSTLPVFLGGRLQAELPLRARLGVNVGWLPPPYLALYGQQTGMDSWRPAGETAFQVALTGSFALGLDMGWRPLKRVGWVVDAGYQMVALNGREARPSPLTQPDPLLATQADLSVDIASYVHMATVSTGYEHVFDKKVVLRFDVGGAFTFATTTAVDASGVTENPERLQEEEDSLRQRYRTVLHTPTVALSVGYRFF